MTDIEFKAPQDIIADLPQERITGDILRGRGPRRGNLERLIRYWRPIMRKPGGFRRCVIILADHPELYPPQRICAWLHHETTGKWPNEGNHHRGGRAVRRVVSSAKKRVRRGRKVYGSDFDLEVAVRRLDRRVSREAGSVIYERIGGSQEMVNYKASRFLRGLASTLLPGERHPLRVSPTRRAVMGVPGRPNLGHGLRRPGKRRRCPKGTEFGGQWVDAGQRCGRRVLSKKSEEKSRKIPKRIGEGIVSALTPLERHPERISPTRSVLFSLITPGRPGGGRGIGGPNVLGRAIGGGRRAMRCPAGFEHGGRFSNRFLSNCGRQVFQIPGTNPNRSGRATVTGAQAERFISRFVSASGRDVSDRIRNEDSVVNEAVRLSRATDITAPGKESTTRVERGIESVLRQMPDGDSAFSRLVRRDGSVLEPTVGLAALAGLKDNDSLNGGTIVHRATSPSDIDQAVPLVSAGAERVVFSTPDGNFSIAATRKLTGADKSSITRTYSAISRNTSPGYERLQQLAERSNGRLEFDSDFAGTAIKKGDNPLNMPAATVIGAIEGTDRYNISSGGSGRKVVKEGKATKYVIDSRGTTNEKVSRMVASDLRDAIGAKTPKTTLADYEGDRVTLSEAVPNVDTKKSARDADFGDRVLAVLADYLTDEQGRSPGNSVIGTGGLYTPPAKPALGKTTLAQRQGIGVEAWFRQNPGTLKTLIDPKETIDKTKRSIAEKMYRLAIDRAEKFDWNEYAKRLAADGKLTSAERKHLTQIKTLASKRIANLKKSLDSFLKVIGSGD